MQIVSGLLEHMVLQRTSRNVSNAAIAGLCTQSGPVIARVTSGRATLRGFAGARVGMAGRGKFVARLKGLPVGGPYTISLSVGADALTVQDVLVGDVWLLGGQSNMEGIGLISGALRPHPLARAFAMDDSWGVARDPIHDLDIAVDPVHPRLRGVKGKVQPVARLTGVGPGVPFAQELLRRTGVPQGLIACGHGGTSMEQWNPAHKKLGGDSLYGATLRRFAKNGSRVAGLLWYQGESDADAQRAKLYTPAMVRLVKALRKDTAQPRLPVVIVQISRVLSRDAQAGLWWNSIQDQQRRLPEVIRHLATVPAIDLPMDDSIHISGQGHQTLGIRLAEAMLHLTAGRQAAPAPIALASVALKPNPRGWGDVNVRFANVVGALRAAGRPVGFELGTPLPSGGIFDVQLKGDTAIVRTVKSPHELSGMMLSYGAGSDPVCNIVDQGNRSLPVFGPLPLGKPRAVTSFVRGLRVSEFLPGAGRLERFSRPDLARLKMTPRTFGADFCDLHTDIQARGGADEVVCYACKFTCPQPMRLRVELGYDGPVKAWVDGRLVFHDPKGTNPAQPTDKGSATVTASAGEHELVIALGTNHGAAWGIFLRMERLDVPARLVMRGPGAYVLPTLLG